MLKSYIIYFIIIPMCIANYVQVMIENYEFVYELFLEMKTYFKLFFQFRPFSWNIFTVELVDYRLEKGECFTIYLV